MYYESTKCIVCGTQGAVSPTIGTDDKPADASPEGMRMAWECQRCGFFETSASARDFFLVEQSDIVRAKISGWIRDQYTSGSVAKVTLDTLNHVTSRPIPSTIERVNRLLLEAARGQEFLGERFDAEEPRFLAATYSANREDIDFIMSFLSSQGLAEYKTLGGGKNAEILPLGYVRVDELTRKSSDSVQGFVAMWFKEELIDTYAQGFEQGILNAGYNPTRMDRVEHINRIDDEIIAQIKQSRFVVADFTGHRSGVYFEAGFALGMNLPVIWTCHKDDMANLHFDIRQFNYIDWETIDELTKRLQMRIEAVLGPGPYKKSRDGLIG
ncbi:MAG: hypothetical protein G8345_03495 [Magnetococcales bacterium]|nr:hypothetical protein [Magnetococcales bacterium]NGZ25939.1 hypothetical protein [Magnetococcales bacterium]